MIAAAALAAVVSVLAIVLALGAHPDIAARAARRVARVARHVRSSIDPEKVARSTKRLALLARSALTGRELGENRAARNRNLLVASAAGRSEMFRARATHGDLFSGDARLADARTFTRLAQEEIPCLLAGDWNGVPSGPLWDDTAINQPELWDQPWKRAHRIRWRHGGRAAWLCASHAEADKLQTQLTSLV